MKKLRFSDLGFFALILCGLINLAFNIADFEKQEEEKPVTLETYHKIVGEKNKVVLVYFSASWCNVCARFKPLIRKIETDYGPRLKVLKIDTERDEEVAKAFEINSLPLLILYKDGEEKWVSEGLVELSVLTRNIDCYL